MVLRLLYQRRKPCYFLLLHLGVLVFCMLLLGNFLLVGYHDAVFYKQIPASSRTRAMSTTVALLFLTKGPLPLHSTWELWLQSCDGYIPTSSVVDDRDDSKPRHRSYTSSRWSMLLNEKWRQQQNTTLLCGNMFRVYVHAPPAFTQYNNDQYTHNIWNHGLLDSTSERVNGTGWGSHALTQATVALLRKAYHDHSTNNAWFVLLSESDIPLYDPFFMYQQLMHMNRSMLNACPSDASIPSRWNPEMNIPLENWRKSNQWFALQRRHVDIVLNDSMPNDKTSSSSVYSQFERYCTCTPESTRECCISDEHYIPTLFSIKGVEDEMYCDSWGVAAMEWDPASNYAHPKVFDHQDVMLENVVYRLREKPEEDAMWMYQYSATRMFEFQDRRIEGEKTTHDATRYRCRGAGTLQHHSMLLEFPAPNVRSLTARKFSGTSTEIINRIFTNCTNKLYMLGCF